MGISLQQGLKNSWDLIRADKRELVAVERDLRALDAECRQLAKDIRVLKREARKSIPTDVMLEVLHG